MYLFKITPFDSMITEGFIPRWFHSSSPLPSIPPAYKSFSPPITNTRHEPNDQNKTNTYHNLYVDPTLMYLFFFFSFFLTVTYPAHAPPKCTTITTIRKEYE